MGFGGWVKRQYKKAKKGAEKTYKKAKKGTEKVYHKDLVMDLWQTKENNNGIPWD